MDEAIAIRINELNGYANLLPDTRYFWRVRSNDNYGLHSNWPDGLHWFIYLHQNHPPDPPTSGFSPTSSEEVISLTPTITWNNAIDPDPDDNPGTLIYSLLLYSMDSSTVYQYSTSPGINQVALPTPLPDNTHWRYRVKTTDDQGLPSSWSAVQDFWVRMYNLSPLPPMSGFSAANDTEITTPLPTIAWNAGTDPDVSDPGSTLHYVLQLDSDGEFDTSVARQYTTAPGNNYYAITDSLAEDTHWAFRIRTIDDGGLTSSWSQVQGFWVNYHNQAPGLPMGGLHPANGQIVNTCHPELIWNTSIDPDPSDYPARISYQIQVDNDGEFDTTVGHTYSVVAGINHFTIPDSLAENGRWYYRIRAMDDSGLFSNWTPIQDFWVDQYNSAPQSPLAGFSPANGEEVISLTPSIAWQHATDVDPGDNAANLNYILELDTDTLFTGFFYGDTSDIGQAIMSVTDALLDNMHYFYRLKTLDDGGLASSWSAIQNFWTNHYNYPPEPFPLGIPNNNIRYVAQHISFKWGGTVDYDPLASFTYAFQYSSDSLYATNVRTIYGLADTSLTLLADTLAALNQKLFWRVLAIDDDSLIRTGGIPEESRKLTIVSPGDVNGDGSLLGSDVSYLVAYFKMRNPAPVPLLAADANGDCLIMGGDVTYLVRYFKLIGPKPVRKDCP